MPYMRRHRKGYPMKAKTKMKINGLTVDNITYKEPGNNLPRFVREAAETRGYGDATRRCRCSSRTATSRRRSRAPRRATGRRA